MPDTKKELSLLTNISILKPRVAWVENEIIEVAVGLLPRFSLPTPRRHSDEESEGLRGVGRYASETGRVVETNGLKMQEPSLATGLLRRRLDSTG